MTRIAILSGAGLLGAQIVKELVKHGHKVVELEESKTMGNAPMPSLDFSEFAGVRAHGVQPASGKRVAQWKQERNRRR